MSVERQYQDEIDALKADKECLLAAIRLLFGGDCELAIDALTSGGFTEEDYTSY